MGETDVVSRGVPRRIMDLIIGLLFTATMVLAAGWGTVVWNAARSAEVKNVEQDARLNAIDSKLDRMDGKLDRLLERK